MADAEKKRSARDAWRERPANRGIFRFGPAGKPGWVGYAPDLAAAENRLSFTLRMGNARPMGLQQAWSAADGAGFAFEVLERPDRDLPEIALPRWAKEGVARWAADLGAVPL